MAWQEDPSPRSLRDHLNLIRRYWALLAACSAVGVLVGLSGFLASGTTYSATARVLFVQDPVTVADPVPTELIGRPRADPERTISNEVQIALSDDVRSATRRQVGTGGTVRVEGLEDADVLLFRATASSGAEAAEIANAAADAYVEVRSRMVSASAEEAVAAAEAELRELEDEIQARASGSDAAGYAPLEQRHAAWMAEVERLKLNSVFAASAGPVVLNKATAPGPVRTTAPLGPILLGLLGGTVVGLVIAYTSDALRDPGAEKSEA